MSMTVWLNVRTGAATRESVDDDLSALFSYQEALDTLAEKLQVEPLTTFFDDTDVRYNMDESGEFEESDEGWPTDGAKWHDPNSLLRTVEAIRAHLIAHPGSIPDADGWSQQSVVEEIDILLPSLRMAASKGNTVHLLVVM
jgi:hypothetical protein